jgi:hypothetical protein
MAEASSILIPVWTANSVETSRSFKSLLICYVLPPSDLPVYGYDRDCTYLPNGNWPNEPCFVRKATQAPEQGTT